MRTLTFSTSFLSKAACCSASIFSLASDITFSWIIVFISPPFIKQTQKKYRWSSTDDLEKKMTSPEDSRPVPQTCSPSWRWAWHQCPACPCPRCKPPGCFGVLSFLSAGLLIASPSRRPGHYTNAADIKSQNIRNIFSHLLFVVSLELIESILALFDRVVVNFKRDPLSSFLATSLFLLS